jgi:hypothetical protein
MSSGEAMDKDKLFNQKIVEDTELSDEECGFTDGNPEEGLFSRASFDIASDPVYERYEHDTVSGYELLNIVDDIRTRVDRIYCTLNDSEIRYYSDRYYLLKSILKELRLSANIALTGVSDYIDFDNYRAENPS